MHDTAPLFDARLIVVDDNRNFQILMRTMLRHLGFRHVEVFADPGEALSHVVDNAVDLALVDLFMPGIDGLQWVRRVRRLAGVANPDMGVIMVTGHAVRRIVVEAVAAGVDAVLVKPLSPDILMRHMRQVLTTRPAYVRRAGGYWGPDATATLARLRGDVVPVAPAPVIEHVPAAAERGRRSLPGLDVEIVDRNRYHADALYLD